MLAGTRMSPFWTLLDLRVMAVVVKFSWSYETCKAPVKSSPPTNHLQAGCPSCCPVTSVEALNGKYQMECLPVELGQMYPIETFHIRSLVTLPSLVAVAQTCRGERKFDPFRACGKSSSFFNPENFVKIHPQHFELFCTHNIHR